MMGCRSRPRGCSTSSCSTITSPLITYYGAFLATGGAAALTACTSIAPQTLSTLGAKVETAKVDFAALHQAARRVHYSQKSEAEIRATWPQTVQVGMVKSVEVRYFIERDDKARTQHLSMLGSLSLRDWIDDFDLFLKLDKGDHIQFHRGFEASATAVRREIFPLLHRDYDVVLQGYSMGAGVAAVLSTYLVEDGFRLRRTTTFGQPRVTNAAGAERLAALPITRVVNADDYVAMVPTFPFEHFGEEVILHPGPSYVCLTHATANQISIGELWREEHGLDIANHLTELYI
jgi:triacylglycerol lipase